MYVVHSLSIVAQYSIAWIYPAWLIHSPVNDHLGCCQFLELIDKAAVNIYRFLCGYVLFSCLQKLFVLDKYVRVGLVGHMCSILMQLAEYKIARASHNLPLLQQGERKEEIQRVGRDINWYFLFHTKKLRLCSQSKWGGFMQ